MDYQLFRNILSPYIVDQMSGIIEVKKYFASISAEDAFDKKYLTVITNIIDCLESCEAIKQLASNILDEAEFFSDPSTHKATKNKYLDKILSDSDYFEQTKAFNLSIIQTYVERIIQKQLYEINIKIEENQRSLNKIESASGKRREEFIYSNQPQASEQRTQQQKNIQSNRSPDILIQQPPPPVNEPQQTNKTNLTQEQQKGLNASYLLIEIDQQQSAIVYNSIVEILKFDRPVPEKVLKFSPIPYGKLVGFARGSSVLKKINAIQIDKKQLLKNMNTTLPNIDEKRFAVIINTETEYYILFVDYIVYTEPINGQEFGDDIKTAEGQYRKIDFADTAI